MSISYHLSAAISTLDMFPPFPGDGDVGDSGVNWLEALQLGEIELATQREPAR